MATLRSIVTSTLDDLIVVQSGTLGQYLTVVNGDFGDDTIYGGWLDANDLLGGVGDDSLEGGSQQNTLTGGEGNDTLDASAGLAATLLGDGGNDFLVGSATVSSLLNGGSGADTMVGGRAADTYTVDSALDVVVETFAPRPDIYAAPVLDKVLASVSYTLSANLEWLVLGGDTALDGTGNGSDNRIDGNAAANLLRGLGGSDTLFGNAGDDSLEGGSGADTLNGGAGIDTLVGGGGNDYYVVDNAADAAVETAFYGGIDWVQASVSYTLGAGMSIETLALAGSANLNATGNELDNTLRGNSGDNVLDGGDGIDVVSYGAVNTSVTVNLAAAGANASGHGSDTLLNIEGVIGSLGADVLTGNAGANLLDGSSGADSLSGGAGADRYVVDNVLDVIVEGGATVGEIDRVDSRVSWTLGANLEQLLLINGAGNLNGTGNTLANRITGNTGANQLKGEAGNDTLDGGDGADTLTGGTGADSMTGGYGGDRYFVDNVGDVVVEPTTLASDIDTVISSVRWTLGIGLEHLVLTGTADNATGNALANELTGNDAANQLDGLGGADTMRGGLGNDTYIVDNAGDVIGDSSLIGGGTDLVRSGVTWSLSFLLENLTLTGTGNIRGTGNNSANVLTGNSGANTLDGSAGNDTLIGGSGNDTLIGGTGADRIEATSGADVVVIASGGADVVTGFTTGTDDLRISMATLRIGDGDTAVESAFIRATLGAFSPVSELVIFQQNVGSMTTSGAAAAIGSATSAYTVGAARLFVLDNGVSTTVYRFVAADADAAVEANELTVIATLSGTPATAIGDYLFGA
jgi:Ca2+-binding RTX toxin-like protein